MIIINKLVGGLTSVCAFILFILPVTVQTVHAEIFQYEDASGNIVFTDDRSKIPKNLKVDVRKEEYSSGSTAESAAPAINPQPKSESKPIYKKPRRSTANKTVDTNLVPSDSKTSREELCPQKEKYEDERELKGVWESVLSALRSRNFQEALYYFTPQSRAKYKQLFEIERSQLDAIFRGYQRFEASSIHGIDAEGSAILKEQEGMYSYPVMFIKDPDCKWRIRAF